MTEYEIRLTVSFTVTVSSEDIDADDAESALAAVEGDTAYWPPATFMTIEDSKVVRTVRHDSRE